MSFTYYDWGKREIINNIRILTKRDTYTIYAVILTKYQNYLSTIILKHVNILAKANKSLYGCLLNMTPHDAYSIKINMNTMTLTDINHKKGVKSHYQTNKTLRHIMQ